MNPVCPCALTTTVGARPAGGPVEQLFGVPLRLQLLFLAYLVTVDTVVTQHWLALGLGREINPAMEWIYREVGVAAFIAVKLGLTALCLLWIARRAPQRAARTATLVAYAIYLPVTTLHLLNAYGVGMA